MNLDALFAIGTEVDLGSHTFTADAIKTFARAFDPQPFHVDETLAKNSVFGRLCASGWHTAAVWMKLNVRSMAEAAAAGATDGVEWGPSPGIQSLRWQKPVYAGEMVTFTRRAVAHRRLASRPGWRIVTFLAGATDSRADAVMSFEGAVLAKVG